MIVLKKPRVNEGLTLRARLNMATEERRTAQSKLNKLELEIVSLKMAIISYDEKIEKESKLTVSQHAIDRFRSRVMCLPVQKVKNILNCKELLNNFKQGGAGRYKLPVPFDYVVVAVQDFCVITCFNPNDPEERLELLKAYMPTWIDDRVKQLTEKPDWGITTMGYFKKKYYDTGRNIK